jgi:hypothetical protein
VHIYFLFTVLCHLTYAWTRNSYRMKKYLMQGLPLYLQRSCRVLVVQYNYYVLPFRSMLRSALGRLCSALSPYRMRPCLPCWWRWLSSGMLRRVVSWKLTLMMEAVSTSETSVNFYETTWRHLQEDGHFHTRCCGNLKNSLLIFLHGIFFLFERNISTCSHNRY